jgi:type I restriction enzyme, S subunit
MSWELKSFDELGFIGRGKSRHRPRNDESLYGGEFPLIQTGDVKNANLYITEYSQTYSQKGLDQSKLWEPNTLCITIAANIADTTILGIQACFPDSIIGFVADKNVCDVRFIKYHFDIVQKQMQMVSQGATQDNLSLEKLLKFKVPTPPLETQKRIASILSNYDDLIENNLKRIKLLEETAQNIYKEWFVNFRFPNYEHTEFDAESGLPVGWEMKKVGELVSFKGGYPFKSSEYKDNAKFRIVTIKNVGDRFFDGSNTSGIENIPDKMKDFCKLKEGDILMSLTGNIGRTCLVYGDNYLLNQRIVVVKPVNFENKAFCYFLFNTDSIKGLMNNLASGVAQQNLSPVKLEEQIIPLPPSNLMLQYSEIINGIIGQIILLNKQNQKLKEARDILLPRLMNRTIEV